MKAVFTACLAIGFFFCYSQNNFNQEFIILQNSDTLKGTVSISGQNFTEVGFSDASGNSRNYNASEISSLFDKEWGLFTSLKVSLHLEDPKSEAVQTAPLQLFFEKVSEVNHISLYYFKNGKYGEHYFLQKDSSSPIELLNSERRTVVAGKESTYRDQAYKKTLMENLNDCSSVGQTISSTKFSKKNLHDLFAKYSECFSKPSYQSALDKGEWSFDVMAGGFSSFLKYKKTENSNEPFGDPKSYSSFTIGLSANYLISRKSKKTFVGVELFYRKLETTQEKTFNTTYPPFILDVMRTYKFDYLRINALVKYAFVIKSSVKPFVTFGISNGFAVSHSTQTTDKNTGKIAVNDIPVRTYEQGVIFGAGFDYLKIGVFVRYEYSDGFLVSNEQGKLGVNTLSGGVAYHFRTAK